MLITQYKHRSHLDVCNNPVECKMPPGHHGEEPKYLIVPKSHWVDDTTLKDDDTTRVAVAQINLIKA